MWMNIRITNIPFQIPSWKFRKWLTYMQASFDSSTYESIVDISAKDILQIPSPDPGRHMAMIAESNQKINERNSQKWTYQIFKYDNDSFLLKWGPMITDFSQPWGFAPSWTCPSSQKSISKMPTRPAVSLTVRVVSIDFLLFKQPHQRWRNRSISHPQHFRDCSRHLLRHFRTKLNRINKFVLKVYFTIL